MTYVFKINDTELIEYIEMIPEAYLQHYRIGEPIVFYGLGYEDKVCGVVVLELSGNDVYVQYMNVLNEYTIYLQDFIFSLKYELCASYDRMVWEFIEDSSMGKLLCGCGFEVSNDDIAMFDFNIGILSDAKILNEASCDVISMADTDNIILKKFFEIISEAGKNFVDTPELGKEYLDECSAVYIEDNIPKGILLIKSNEEELVIPYMFSSSKNPMAIVEMMRFTLHKIRVRFDEKTICKTYIIEPTLVSIVERLTGIKGKFMCSGVYGLDNIRNFLNAYKDIEL